MAASTAVAEQLLQKAQERRLTSEEAARAAGLLAHSDPFVRALAEWAIATKVNQDNGGQNIAWPRADAPAWFAAWVALPPERLLEMDYARQAIVWGIHRDGRQLLGSVDKILARARGAASEIPVSAPAATRGMVARQLAALAGIRRQLVESLQNAPDDLTAHRTLWLAARHATRPIVLANPAVDFQQLLFVSLYPAHSHRNITGSQYPWVHKPGGDICVKSGLEPGSAVRGVLQGKLGPGHVHGIDLWWDADRVVFGYARQDKWPPPWDTASGDHVFRLRGHQEPTHIYECRLDGSGLRQLTRHAYWSDLEPTYCADGTVVFASDRSGRSSECGKFSADHTVINLYARALDGRLWRLNDNKDIDRHPHSLDDGRIAYTRWEYQERHFLEVHAVWTMRPDGTMADAVFNQHMRAPFGFRDTRSIPGSPKLVSIATGHHTFAYGPVVVIDPREGISTPAAIQSVTPFVKPQEGPMAGSRVPEGGVPDKGGVYQTPWALSERCFLASYAYPQQGLSSGGGRNMSGFAVYLIDVHGNKELLHRDPALSCVAPIPVRPRRRPPVVPQAVAEATAPGTCYVTDVYEGLDGVPRGAVKHLRILQRVGWPLDDKIGAMRWIPGNAWERKFGFWAWAPVRVLGEVPVAADGSAHFTVPADTAVYFQALDERHMEVRRMRSHITLQPGEVRGCRGCHESQGRAPAMSKAPVAPRREPSAPSPPPWGAHRLLGYEWLVQPVLDRHCVRCHGDAKPDGGLRLTATRAEDGFLTSFHTLFGSVPGQKKRGRPLVCVANRFSGASVSKPLEFGSRKSPFILALL
ncbi:hypothetical protein HQ576_03625, partial [bacterium]|nr:hypothetical protein [bacterium]